ncbi:MAG TPA: methyltransferase domain-containing protein [Jatrophihabitans sp.]|jgi:predicted SAM-dependent methyltransferase|nr:methyltransferase domain-containing protein [Jatrophihabitans sp.]
MSGTDPRGADGPDRFANWNWEDPAELNQVMDDFTIRLATAATLERVISAPYSAAQLATLGITGIEFAAFRTTHPAGLGADLVGLSTPGGGTEPGHIYRVDGSCYFTQLDIAEPLPVADGALDWVYAEHLIEHVSLPTAVHWLTEVRRVLAPGGLLRLTTPDLAKYVAGYAGGDPFFAKHRRRVALTVQVAPAMPARNAFMFNQIFYLYGHRWLYDLAELQYVLGEAGFAVADVRLCEYRSGSRDDIAGLDQKFRSDETIYVEVNS